MVLVSLRNVEKNSFIKMRMMNAKSMNVVEDNLTYEITD